MWILTAIVLSTIFWLNAAFAQNPPLHLYDEGSSQGLPVFELNCVGGGISCTHSGIRGTLTVSSGGGDTYAGVETDGALQSTGAPTLDFDTSDFTLVESPADSFDITINNSGITITESQISDLGTYIENPINSNVTFSGDGTISIGGSANRASEFYSLFFSSGDYYVEPSGQFTFEGATDDAVQTFLVAADPTTSDKTITLPDATGTVELEGHTHTESEISDLAHTVDTNANTICSGTTTYLDGEGNCDDISSVYEPAGITESDISDLDHTATAITNGIIVEPDLDESSGTPTDNDVLTYNLAGTNFTWVAQNTLTAGTAAALAANGANCSAGNYPLGVDATGAVESCTADDDSPDSDAEVPDNITIDAGSVLNSPITLSTTTSTDSGRIAYNATDDRIVVGDGVAIDEFYSGAHTTDTNANTICTGTGNYLDGEGNCDALTTFPGFTDLDTDYGNETISSDFDFNGGTLELPNSTSLPGSCDVGDMYMDTDATSGARFFLCENTNTWVAQVGSAFPGFTDIDTDYGNENVTSDWQFTGASSTGAFGAYDVTIGDGANHGGINIGNTGIYASSYSTGNIDLGQALVFRQEGTLDAGNDPGIEFAFIESVSNTIRLAIPESASGNATAFVRSGTFAGPYSTAIGNDAVTCDQWTTYDSNIDCDTGATGADLFVQDDIENEGAIFNSGDGIFLDADDANQHQITAANATADRVFTFPDDEIASGDLMVGSGAGTFVYTAKSAINLSDFNDDLTHTTDTGPSPDCSGTLTYQDGEGGCDTYTLSGNTTSLGTTSGTLTSGNCVEFDASGNLVDSGSACGGGSDTFASIEEDGVAISTNAPTLDFDSTDFTITESPTDDFDIAINNSGITITESQISDLQSYLTAETNDLESVATNVGDAEVFVGTGAGTGAYISGLAACAADAKIEYVPGSPDTFTCEAITITESDISDLSHTTDTNANTLCTGTTTYLDGEGNCDDISSVYEPTIGADTLTHADIADADQADTKCWHYYESDGIDADDDWTTVWHNGTGNDFLITSIWCETDTGTVTSMLQVDDGTPADVDSVDLVCAATAVEDTSLNGDTTVAAGEELDFAITSTATTPLKVAICWTGNWVD